MSKLSDIFSMSKQERNGAWLIVALIVILIAAVFIERKCSNDNVDPSTQKEINEYVEKASKIKVKDKKAKSTKTSTKKTTKGKSTNDGKKKTEKKDNKKSTTKGKSTNKKTTKKQDSAKKNTKKSCTPNSKKKTSSQRLLEPVPQF